MTNTDLEIVRERALALPPLLRIQLVDSLVDSLDEPDPAIQTAWTQEAQRRLDAYSAGQIKAVPMPQALSAYYASTQRSAHP